MTIRFSTIIFVLFCLLSCQTKSEKGFKQLKPGKDQMTDLNQYFVQKDRERILNFIERKNLQLTESPTGLWYSIYSEGSGQFLKDNDRLLMEYECSLLDGTYCYSSKELGPKEIVIGKSQLEPGLNEGLRMLKPGAEAIFILPPFLAYGLVGDGEKIPSRAIVIYHVNILQTN
jgi:FKBP-type peptidyl-prolyl cis-trans isomerase FkpA